jgi:hypothetical protein
MAGLKEPILHRTLLFKKSDQLIFLLFAKPPNRNLLRANLRSLSRPPVQANFVNFALATTKKAFCIAARTPFL